MPADNKNLPPKREVLLVEKAIFQAVEKPPDARKPHNG